MVSPKIVPGTKYITVGGAIAVDIHGKNHHVGGCFFESVNWLELYIPGKKNIVKCSKTENNEYFHSTCGGMGLTGIILRVELLLEKIFSKNINQVTIKTDNLKETLKYLKIYKKIKKYSVAWIDCLEQEF